MGGGGGGGGEGGEGNVVFFFSSRRRHTRLRRDWSSDVCSSDLHEAAAFGHKEIAELLIAAGADVDAKDENGYTPLFNAAYWGRKEIVELLIANGADVNAKIEAGEFKGKTPLDRVIIANHSETAELLRKHGGKTSEELKAEGK